MRVPGLRRMRFACALCLLGCLLAPAGEGGLAGATEIQPAPVNPAPSGAGQGRAEILVALVSGDLSVRPVPKFRLRVDAENAPPGAEPVLEVVTGFDGRADFDLRPGRYRISCPTPVPWEGTGFSWNLPFEVVAGMTVRLELSNDNARKTAAPEGRVTPEAEIFRTARDAVFLIETESSQGSGFLVDPAGLILTNAHVVSSVRYAAAKLDRKRKYPVEVLALDKDHDIAVTRIHSDAIRGIRPLSLAAPDPGTSHLVEGERVLAIGNPLGQEGVLTTGIISKIESDTIISDVNINPGNSGGPLLNLQGKVVGLNTFGLSAGRGPGISGIVRIHLAERVLEEARRKAGTTGPPPASLLPVASEVSYPAAALRDTFDPKLDTDVYEYKLDNLSVFFKTPPLLYFYQKQGEVKAAEQQKKRRKQQPEETAGARNDASDLKRYEGLTEPVVIVQALPKVKMTGGGKAAAFFGVGPIKHRFKTDFREMKLLRGGEPVQPILPGRSCETVDLPGLKDVACFGQYKYPPEAFRPGATLELLVYDEDNPNEPERVPLTPETIDRIWRDFQPHFQAIPKESAGESTPPAPPR